MNIRYIWAKFMKKMRGSATINSNIPKSSKVGAGSQIVNSSFGAYSYCGYDCEIINCSIGSFCSLSNGIKIGGGFHPMDWVSMSPVFHEGSNCIKINFAKHKKDEDKRSSIGHDVWIGMDALIKQGVSIGNGAVVGMGSVVTKSIPPYEIWAGNPARFIRKRFSDEIIEELSKTEWWNFNIDKIKRAAVYVNQVDEFIKICND